MNDVLFLLQDRTGRAKLVIAPGTGALPFKNMNATASSHLCAAIAVGMNSEAIALTLGIRLNTVLTYRKRAYARLGICSQNELVRLIYTGLAAGRASGTDTRTPPGGLASQA